MIVVCSNAYCPRCGANLHVDPEYGYSAHCPDCYDGGDDGPEINSITGQGHTAELAISDFEERMREAMGAGTG